MRAHGRRRLIQGAAGGIALAFAPRIASAASFLALRVWPAPEYTRVTIEHDGPIRFQHFLLRDAAPLRLVVDIEGLALNNDFLDQVRKVAPEDPFVARIRVARFRPGVLRLVVELKKTVEPQVFALEPAGPYRERLVLDLYPEGGQDPILALMRAQSEQPPMQPAPEESLPPAVTAPGAQAAPQSPAAPPPESARPGTDTPQAPEAPRTGQGNTASEDQTAPRGGSRTMRRLVTIAIDPGHGGEDPGAIGHRGTYEKLVTLSIARQLAALVQEQADYRVLLTRDADYFVPLAMRVEKARNVQADLFVSIHADAWLRSDARGSSVFALSERGASSAAAAELARQQNDADRIGGINRAIRNTAVERVVLDLSTTAQISDSLRVGDAVLHEIEHINRLHRGHVEQAAFAVLKAPEIPSILVETAFISNPDEEARLREPGYQRDMAQALFEGLRSYFSRHPPQVRNPIG